MTSWFSLLFWVLAHSLWQAAIVWGVYRAARVLRPHLPSWSASVVASLAVFSIPLLSTMTAVALVSQALAATPSSEEGGFPGILAPAALWMVTVALLGARLLVAMGRSLARKADDDATPCVVGWLSPRIVVPDSIASRLPEDQLKGIIAHEQEHVRAGDAWVNLLQCWLDVCYFFNPAYRSLSRAARAEREFRCDDAAARQVGTLVYLRALVEVARAAAIPNSCELSAAGDFERRVARLADGPASRGGRLEPWAAFASVLVLVAVLPNAASVPAGHTNTATWQARMVRLGKTVRTVVVPPLQTVGHSLKKVAR